ncbi:hypothetical protein PYW07_002934 [Mythimna separata]|uniref:Peptidase S1 domain-containing protein n=1 Tax=Mythimna separata TaxID=271217 RepID=A0AAD7YHS1_MYTSE|nr:hypothetical protein PYW07_002934 [Mythimna separata]
MSESDKIIIKCFIVIFLFITVSPARYRYKNNYVNNRNEDDQWVWGYVVNNKPKNKPTLPLTPVRAKKYHTDPCRPYNPPQPSFRAPGRRPCEIKCYEYIWQLKIRHIRNQRLEKCHIEMERSMPNFNLALGAIGGHDTEAGEFPHMGAIGWQASSGGWVFKCGSSLISPTFVLTAGHCSRAVLDTSISDPVPKIVRLGDKNIIDVYTNGFLPIDAMIRRIIVHPFYRPPKKYYDIALMEFEKPVEFSKFVQPACLWTKYNTSSLGTEAILTGWGVVETTGKTISPELQAAVVDFIDTSLCDQLLYPSCNRNWCGVRDNQICAGKLAGGVDACQGDSGGPLQVQIPLPITTEGNMHYIVGVTSFGIGCALPNLPGIYSRVSMYLDWIESVVWPGM